MSIGAVVNPVAAGGRAGSLWSGAENALRAHFGEIAVRFTQGPDQAAELAAELAASGASIVIACGGDGTISEVADGILRARQRHGSEAKLGIVPAGTGSDLARTLGLQSDVPTNVARIIRGEFRAVDCGKVSYLMDSGAPASRHFINIASLGLSGPTDRAVNAAKGKYRYGGKLVFMYHTIRELLRYRFQEVRIAVDDAKPVDTPIAVVAIANGRYFGGGMMIAPDASPDDGAFDVVIFRAAGKFELLRNMNLVYSGAHGKLAAVTILRGKKVVVEPLGDPALNSALLDIDGESPGKIPATFEILPGAIQVAV